MQQNPCEIAGALEAACEGYSAFKQTFRLRPFRGSRSAGVYELGPLAQGTNYVAPQTNTSEQSCQCNTVMYRYRASRPGRKQALIAESCSLYMACTACQNVTTQPWGFWSQFCPEVYVAQYPEPIPANTAVPHWAFLNVTVCVRRTRRAPYLTLLVHRGAVASSTL